MINDAIHMVWHTPRLTPQLISFLKGASTWPTGYCATFYQPDHIESSQCGMVFGDKGKYKTDGRGPAHAPCNDGLNSG